MQKRDFSNYRTFCPDYIIVDEMLCYLIDIYDILMDIFRNLAENLASLKIQYISI